MFDEIVIGWFSSKNRLVAIGPVVSEEKIFM
jgi:hypothetical protein